VIKPMLAVPMSKANITDWTDWIVEEKYDGHRLIVQVAHLHIWGAAKPESNVIAWTRPRQHAGATGKTMLERPLPSHLIKQLKVLPTGTYDGELVGGRTSTDVSRLDVQASLRFVVFDVLQHEGADQMSRPLDQRRRLLAAIFRQDDVDACEHLMISTAIRVTCQDDVTKFVTEVWTQGGEGAILKRRAAPYQPGKRSPDFIKVKKLFTEVMTVVGFEATRGKVMNRGPFATVVLEDSKGNRTSVKTVDDVELEKFNREWDQRSSITTHRDTPDTSHPALGRKLRIEYQDRTPDGGYRHPRWDRWEDE